MQPFGLKKYVKTKHLTPKYCSIQINGNNRQNRKIRTAAPKKECDNLYNNCAFVGQSPKY
jgi:hypothetical protein